MLHFLAGLVWLVLHVHSPARHANIVAGEVCLVAASAAQALNKLCLDLSGQLMSLTLASTAICA